MDKLLELLEENGRAPIDELAAALELSEEEVVNKIKEYEEQGIIKGYKTVINKQALKEKQPTTVTSLIEVNISPQPNTGFDEIAQEIYEHPEVKSCYLCSGDYDLLLRVEADSLNEVAEFVARELAPCQNVHKTESHFMLKPYKEDGINFEAPTSDHRLTISP